MLWRENDGKRMLIDSLELRMKSLKVIFSHHPLINDFRGIKKLREFCES